MPVLDNITLRWDYILLIIVFYGLAWVVHRLSNRLAARLVGLTRLQRQMWPQRQATLRGVASGIVSFVAIIAATLFSLSLFVDTDTLIWMVGLFSAAFGLGARPLVSDFLSGLSFLFENSFAVGEKVQMAGLPGGTVEGTIENVKLRTTYLRATTGELYTVPNGEIRVIRNFSRGRFSMASVHIKVNGVALQQTLDLLDKRATDAVAELPNLLEPWQVISESGVIGEHTELTILAKARFGHAAELRPRLLTLIQDWLAEAGIELVD